jgi:hypothetical protein
VPSEYTMCNWLARALQFRVSLVNHGGSVLTVVQDSSEKIDRMRVEDGYER